MTVVLVRGNDPALVGQALQRVVSDLVGGGDRSLLVEELTDADYRAGDGDPDLSVLVYAAHTPPFLTERRVVVGRHLNQFGRKAQVAPLVQYLAEPLVTTDLVLVWEKAGAEPSSPVPKSLQQAVIAVGGTVVDAAPTGKARRDLLDQKLAAASVRLDQAARELVATTLGDDVGRLDPLLAGLAATYGDGARLGREEVAPFVGAGSEVPPWALTDAIEGGDIAAAIELLHRMLNGGARHPLEVMATLHRTFEQALALDGAGARTDKEAAGVLGMTGSTFPAKKALARSRRLGRERLAEAMRLLARADLDLRGASGLDVDVVMEILVARLTRLHR